MSNPLMMMAMMKKKPEIANYSVLDTYYKSNKKAVKEAAKGSGDFTFRPSGAASDVTIDLDKVKKFVAYKKSQEQLPLMMMMGQGGSKASKDLLPLLMMNKDDDGDNKNLMMYMAMQGGSSSNDLLPFLLMDKDGDDDDDKMKKFLMMQMMGGNKGSNKYVPLLLPHQQAAAGGADRARMMSMLKQSNSHI